ALATVPTIGRSFIGPPPWCERSTFARQCDADAGGARFHLNLDGRCDLGLHAIWYQYVAQPVASQPRSDHRLSGAPRRYLATPPVAPFKPRRSAAGAWIDRGVGRQGGHGHWRGDRRRGRRSSNEWLLPS